MVYLTRKKGGKYIASGTYGCVFGKPPLKCIEDAKRLEENVISKLMDSDSADKEYYESERWRAIDPEQKFSLYAFKKCEFDNTNIKPENNFKKCDKSQGRDTLLFYKNGGFDLDKLKPEAKLYKYLFKAFQPLLDGLVKAHEINLVHTDIKKGNILAELKKDKIHLRFIDFGLSFNTADYGTLPEYMNASMYTENNTFYPYWPFEFGCINTDGTLKSSADIIKRYIKYNNKLENQSSYIGLPKINISNSKIIIIYKNTNFKNFRTIFEKVDVYSIGVLLSELLYQYFSHSIVQLMNGKYVIYYYDRKSHNYSSFYKLKDRKYLTDKQCDIHLEIYENLSKPLVEFIEMCSHIDPNIRYTAKQAAEHYRTLLPLFDTYLDTEKIESGLENQKILDVNPEFLYIKTPTPNIKKLAIKTPTPENKNSSSLSKSYISKTSPKNKSFKIKK